MTRMLSAAATTKALALNAEFVTRRALVLVSAMPIVVLRMTRISETPRGVSAPSLSSRRSATSDALTQFHALQTLARNIFQNVVGAGLPRHVLAIQNLDVAGVLAAPFAMAGQRQVHLFAERADPADLPCRRADHHGP